MNGEATRGALLCGVFWSVLLAAACARAQAAVAPAPPAAEALSVPAVTGAGSGSTADGPLPERLADTGLYSDAATLQLAGDVLAFEPQYPLWSDGAAKRRWIRLPPGTVIDASRPDEWTFPVGTRFWKEFAFERRVETRMLELVAPGRWRFATYVWDEDGSDARLAPERGLRRAWVHADGTPYDLPARADCTVCHGAGPNAVLGFGALQLSPDRDPLAPHAVAPPAGAVDLAWLLERGLIVGLPAELRERPPRIEARGPRERAVLGYLHANCGTCHAGTSSLAGLGLALDASASAPAGLHPALGTTIDVPSRFVPRGAAEGARRIVPGDPEASVLVARAGTRNPLVQMPPLGTHVVDRDALDLIQAWIREDLLRSPRHEPRPPVTPSEP